MTDIYEALTSHESGAVYVDKMPPTFIDGAKNQAFVNGIELKLIRKLVVQDGEITIEKLRVYVPGFDFVDPWENIFGSNVPAEDEAVEDYDKNVSPVFLDKKSRRPLVYKFIIDKEGNLYYHSKWVEED